MIRFTSESNRFLISLYFKCSIPSFAKNTRFIFGVWICICNIIRYKSVHEFFQKKYKECKLEPMANLQLIIKSNSINYYLYRNDVINNIVGDTY